MSEAALEIPRKVRNAVYNAMGYHIEDRRVKGLMELYFFTLVADLRSRLRKAKADFDAAGGRGVAIADQIDDLRIAIAIKKATAKGWDRPVRHGEVKASGVEVGPIKTLRDLRRRTAEEQYQGHVNHDEEADIVESTGFSQVGPNKMRCHYWISSSAKGRTKKVAFTVVFADDSAEVEDTEVQ